MEKYMWSISRVDRQHSFVIHWRRSSEGSGVEYKWPHRKKSLEQDLGIVVVILWNLYCQSVIRKVLIQMLTNRQGVLHRRTSLLKYKLIPQIFFVIFNDFSQHETQLTSSKSSKYISCVTFLIMKTDRRFDHQKNRFSKTVRVYFKNCMAPFRECNAASWRSTYFASVFL